MGNDERTTTSVKFYAVFEKVSECGCHAFLPLRFRADETFFSFIMMLIKRGFCSARALLSL